MPILSEKDFNNTQVIIVLGEVVTSGKPFVAVTIPTLGEDHNFQALKEGGYITRIIPGRGDQGGSYILRTHPFPGVAGVRLCSKNTTCILYLIPRREKRKATLKVFTQAPGLVPDTCFCRMDQIVSCTIGGLRKTKPGLNVELTSLEDAYFYGAGEYTILRRIEQIGRSLALGLTKRGSQ